MIRTAFQLTSATLHDPEVILSQQNDETIDPSIFLQNYSLHRVKKKYKNIEDLNLVVYSRLDLLFTKPLTENDVSLINHQDENYLSTTIDKNCFITMGRPMIMNIFADRHPTEEDLGSFLDSLKAHHNVKIQIISTVCTRILPNGLVHSQDSLICPYLGDLISSSNTKIHLHKRKNSLK